MVLFTHNVARYTHTSVQDNIIVALYIDMYLSLYGTYAVAWYIDMYLSIWIYVVAWWICDMS